MIMKEMGRKGPPVLSATKCKGGVLAYDFDEKK